MEWLIVVSVVLLVVAFLLKGKIGTEGQAAYREQGPLFTRRNALVSSRQRYPA